MSVNDYIKKSGQASIDTFTLSDSQLKRLQDAELEIASDVISLCEEKDIPYMLSGGSALGALRHSGFIPWDDDIDINMRRRDWNELYPYILSNLGEKYWIYSLDCYENCTINAIRIYRKGTKLREVGKPPSEEEGIFIDIFLLENAPNNSLMRFFQGTLSMVLRYLCSCARINLQISYFNEAFSDNKNALRLFRFRSVVGNLCKPIGMKRLLRAYDSVNAMCNDDESRYVTIPTGGKSYFGELMRRDDVFPPTESLFCGKSWHVPRNAPAYLERLYGDWESIPDEAHRERHVLVELDFGEGAES